MRTFLTSFLATIVLLAVTAMAAAGGVTMVSQKGRAFTARSVQIAHGDTVQFNNEDMFLHQVYVHSPTTNYESDEQEPGTSVAIQFSKAGTFEVRCQIHPKMLLLVDAR